jgi:hypothetical protein
LHLGHRSERLSASSRTRTFAPQLHVTIDAGDM